MAINKTKSGTFRVDFRDQTGRRLRKTFDTLKAAREYDRISKGIISKNDFVAPSAVTLRHEAESWYDEKKDAGTYRYSTLQAWRLHLDKHILPSLGDLRIQQCTVEHIEKAAAIWAKTTSPTTANKMLTT